ncbi:uncharacterized protein LOC121696342 isoform X5 [Alosa sapidissima]|uniref:uncharacterized protein LOC121696342 isoform X5 n=1 Tax=Alosa sapidissima TaxID=34773 RepID=UPI001C097295|nr:uncharacterized protein LOC121696342 isoform X5 [Alosa sapidissima]
MVSGTCCCWWWLGLCFLLATPCCSLVTNPDYYRDSLRLPEEAPPSQSERLYKGPSLGLFGRPNSFTCSRGYTKSSAVNMKPAGTLPPSPAGQQSGGSSYGGNVPNQGSLSSWGVRPVDSSRNDGPSANTAVDGSTSSTNYRPVTSQSTGNTHYRPVAGQSKGSVGYRPTNQLSKAEVNSGQCRPYPAKPALGKDDVEQVLVRPNSPAWSAKPSSAAVVGSTSGVSYKPVTAPSKGSMYRPANEQLKPSTSFGQYRPYTAKPALGKDEDVKQLLVRPNSPAWSAKPSSAAVVGSTTDVSYKPVTAPSEGSMYRPANEQLKPSTSFGQYRPDSAKPALGKDEGVKQVLVGPNSPAWSAKPSSAAVVGSTTDVSYKPVTAPSEGSMYRPANEQLKPSTSFGQYRPDSAKPALGKDEGVKQVLVGPNSPAWSAKPSSAAVVGSTTDVSYKPVTAPSEGSMYRPANEQLKPSTSFDQYRPYPAKPALGKDVEQVLVGPNSPAWSAKPSSAAVVGSTTDVSYKPVTALSKGSMYRPANEQLMPSTSSGQYRPDSAKPALGKDEGVKQVLVGPNSPAWSAKPSSAAVVGSTTDVSYKPVTAPSEGSMYRPANEQLKPSTSFGQYRPYPAKPALGKDEDVEQVLVRPNSPAWSAKPSSAAVVGSTTDVSYKPVTAPSKGSMYRPANEQLKPSTSFGQYRPYPAKPALGKDEYVKQVLVGPNSPAWSAKPSSAAEVGSTSGVSYKPVTAPSKGSMYRPANEQLMPSTSSGQYRPDSAKPALGKDEGVKQLLVGPNSPAWSAKPSSAAVVGSTTDVSYKPVTAPSKGSMYRPANEQLMPSTSSGQYRPDSAKLALGKDEGVKQVLVGPNSPACFAKPSSAAVVGSTSGVSYKPVTAPSKGSMYRPANEQLMPSTSSGQYRPDSAKPEVTKQLPVRPKSSASSAKTPSGSFGSPQAQWAQAEVSSSTYGQAGQATWQSQATSTSSNSQNYVPQSHRGNELVNLAYSTGACQQGEDSVPITIPSYLGIGVIEVPCQRNEEGKLRPATQPQASNPSYPSWRYRE